MNFKGMPEFKILVWLGIIALGWYLLGVFGSVLGTFADIFLLLILSWILAFILEPLVAWLTKHNLSRTEAAVITYLALAVSVIILIWVILPTTISQLSQFIGIIPRYLPQNSLLSNRIETFLTGTLGESLTLASSVASTLTGILLVFILSFYFLISRKEISQLLVDLIPGDYKEDYLFLEKVISQTFAVFLQIQIVLGIIMGTITFITMFILGINLALSTSILAAILAMVPAIGPLLMLFPVILATLSVSAQKMFVALAIIIIAGQIVYNFLSSNLLGAALKIHPIIVLLSFLVGYRLGGVWGAVFAVPLTSALAITGKEILKYWQEEADK